MAYVQPNSTVQLFKGINLDNRYMHTIYFASEAAQNTWFTNKVTSALTFSNLMYRRYTSQAVKVEADATSLLGVTYMRFKNTRTGAKWFYAFVLNVDYVNENTAVVYYEIDVMQTWFMQGGSVRPCMVLREHVNDDTFGINLEEEPIGSDVYECDQLPYTLLDETGHLFENYALVVNTNENPVEKQLPILNNKLINGTCFYKFNESDYANEADYVDAVEQFLDVLIQNMNGNWEDGSKPIEVVDMFTFPEKFASYSILNNTHSISITHPTTLSGYTPKNKKLYSYPYSFLQLTTKNGEGCSLKWEYFSEMLVTRVDAIFTAYGSAIGGGTIQCYPIAYNGIANNIDAGLTLDNFPKNSFTYDAYQAWVASGGSIKLSDATKITNIRGVTATVSAVSSLVTDVSSGISDIATSASDEDIAGVVNGINKIVQGATKAIDTTLSVKEAKNKIKYAWKDAAYQPNIIVGKATPSLSVSKRSLDFYFQNVHVKVDELKRLDDFLSCYGYSCKRVKAPNLTGRQYWNFVQTQNAVIAGDMPSSSKEAIGRIFDGGITFWHNGDQVGNYRQSVSNDSIDNPIVT